MDVVYHLITGETMAFEASKISGWMAMNGEAFTYTWEDGLVKNYWFPATSILFKETTLNSPKR